MINQELYQALQEAKRASHGGLSVLLPKGEDAESRHAFDRLVLCVQQLRSLGWVDFTERQLRLDRGRSDFAYLGLVCRLTYPGEQALSYGSWEEYLKHQPCATPLAIIDNSLTIQGNVSGSNIASHAPHVHQTTGNPEWAYVIKKILETLQQDMTLSAQSRQEAIADAHLLYQELLRSTPRAAIIRAAYAALSNTASIIPLVRQLHPLLTGLL